MAQASPNQLQLALPVLPSVVTQTRRCCFFCLALAPVIWTEKSVILEIHGMLTCLSNPSRFGAETLLWVCDMVHFKKQNIQLPGWIRPHIFRLWKNVQQLLMVRKNLQKNCEMARICFSLLTLVCFTPWTSNSQNSYPSQHPSPHPLRTCP